MIKISPSMLSCDFAKIGAEAARMEACGADWLHLDVMDGQFVPNITFGAPVIAAMRPHTALPFDLHLMIREPLRYIDDFARAGADLITFHVESDSPVQETIDRIRAAGCKPGLSVKPGTPVEAVFPYLERLAMVLVMTVEPGFGGQSFMPDMMAKVRTLRAEALRRGLALDIQVDGGIGSATVETAAAAGANVLVAGSAVFGATDPAQAIAALRTKAEAAFPQT